MLNQIWHLIKKFILMIERLFDLLSSRHPLWYLLVYLLLIPECALFYYRYDDEIYSPYARFESIGIENDDNLKSMLELDMKSALKEDRSRKSFRATIDGSSIRLRNMEADPQGNIQAMIEVRYDYPGGQSFKRRGTINISSIAFDVGPYVYFPANIHEDSPSPFDDAVVEPLGNMTHLVNARKITKLSSNHDVGIRVIYVPSDKLDFINYFKQGRRGSESYSARSSFERMLYFSATTLTTVGYGDLIPVSRKTRLVVGAESVLGWILAGLFLNAAAWRGAHRQVGPSGTSSPPLT